MKTILVIDAHYLCHRAFHSTSSLRYQERPTGVLFGFFRSLLSVQEQFMPDRTAFCFEHPHSYRREWFPEYKSSRRKVKRTPEEKHAYSEFLVQVTDLQKRHLPEIGFSNIFSCRGLESDDVMAAIAADRSAQGDTVVLVTADSDLFQCLSQHVLLFSPQRQQVLTRKWFRQEYGIKPRQWAEVKAIAGCQTDGVPGVRGVGEKTALRFVRGILPPSGAAHNRILAGRSIVERNRRLVRLPFPGCPVPSLKEDHVSRAGWINVCRQLGMKSLASHLPL